MTDLINKWINVNELEKIYGIVPNAPSSKMNFINKKNNKILKNNKIKVEKNIKFKNNEINKEKIFKTEQDNQKNNSSNKFQFVFFE